MYDDTFNFLTLYGWGAYILPINKFFFVFLKWPSEQSFLRHIFKSKPHTRLAFAHAQITHFELGSDFTDFPIFLAF